MHFTFNSLNLYKDKYNLDLYPTPRLGNLKRLDEMNDMFQSSDYEIRPQQRTAHHTPEVMKNIHGT
jgi:hypothetical protein